MQDSQLKEKEEMKRHMENLRAAYSLVQASPNNKPNNKLIPNVDKVYVYMYNRPAIINL